MSGTAQRQTLPTWITLLDSLRPFSLLPSWLVSAADSERVCGALRSSIPEFASGALTLNDCQIKHLRLSDDGSRWSGTYHCTITGRLPSQRRSVSLLGILIPPHEIAPDQPRTAVAFASEGWRWYVPELRLTFQMQPSDTQLVAPVELTDPEKARTFLEQSLERSGSPLDRPHIASCRPQVLRYHPGLRCTVGYHLTYQSDAPSGSNWPPFVVAKTYEDERGQNAFDAMQALRRSPLGASRAVAIAEPIAYFPERRLLVQGPLAEEQTLRALVETALVSQSVTSIAELGDYLRKTAIGLAELHTTGVSLDRPHRWHDELSNVRALVQRLITAVPELALAAGPLFPSLEALANASPPDPEVPSHGTFRPAQVLLHQGRIGFIDFDSSCQAEPAMDLALFMVALIDIGMSTAGPKQRGTSDGLQPSALEDRLMQLEAIAESFLSHYAALRPISRRRVAVWQALNILELVARSWERVKPIRLRHTLLMLERHLRAHLAERAV